MRAYRCTNNWESKGKGKEIMKEGTTAEKKRQTLRDPFTQKTSRKG